MRPIIFIVLVKFESGVAIGVLVFSLELACFRVLVQPLAARLRGGVRGGQHYEPR